jgi:hypothetical protein
MPRNIYLAKSDISKLASNRIAMKNKYWIERKGFMFYGLYTRLPFDIKILVKVFTFNFTAKRYLKRMKE